MSQCKHENTWFSRVLCDCDPNGGWMHTYCEDCSRALDGPCSEGALTGRQKLADEIRRELVCSCVEENPDDSQKWHGELCRGAELAARLVEGT